MLHRDTPENTFGMKVVDVEGQRVGTVEALYVDEHTDEPEYALIELGLFGFRSAFVPLGGARFEAEAISVTYPKRTVKDAPSVSPGDLLEDEEVAKLDRHYGVERSQPPERGSGTPGEDRARQASREDVVVGPDLSEPAARVLKDAVEPARSGDARGGEGEGEGPGEPDSSGAQPPTGGRLATPALTGEGTRDPREASATGGVPVERDAGPADEADRADADAAPPPDDDPARELAAEVVEGRPSAEEQEFRAVEAEGQRATPLPEPEAGTSRRRADDRPERPAPEEGATGRGDRAEPGERAADRSDEAERPDEGDHPDGTDLPDDASLEDRTVDELRELAAQRDITGRSSMNKAQLVAALSGDDGGETPLEEHTVDELRELAAQRDITGRSSMTKEQLVAALSGEASGGGGSRGRGSDAQDGGPSRTRYEDRTVDELRELAAQRNIPGRSTMNKDELIAALRR